MKKYISLLKNLLLVGSIILPFLYWIGSQYINLDFWFDEIFSLHRFTFTPLPELVTHYGAPNNHLFFNLINHIYLKSIGIQNMYAVMDAPFKIRLLMLIYSLMTCFYLYLIGRRFVNKTVAYLAVVFLVTSVPYYNFAVQMRGYGLSMFFLCIVLYHAWSFEDTLAWIDGLFVIVFSVLALYTIPLNLYVLASLAIFYGTFGLALAMKHSMKPVHSEIAFPTVSRKRFRRRFRYLLLPLGVGLAVGIAVLLYWPILPDVINNRHVNTTHPFNMDTIFRMMPQTWNYFLSQRYLLIPTVVVPFLVWWNPSLRQRYRRQLYRGLQCFCLLVLPFALSCIRGDQPFYRVFVNLCPVFALFMALAMYLFWRLLPQKFSNMTILSIFVIIYCHLTFSYAVSQKDAHLHAALQQGEKLQNIYYNYYQAYYAPRRTIEVLLRNYQTHPLPVLLLSTGPEEYEMRTYLEKFCIQFLPIVDVQALATFERAYILSPFTSVLRTRLAQSLPEAHCITLQNTSSFHDILGCEAFSPSW